MTQFRRPVDERIASYLRLVDDHLDRAKAVWADWNPDDWDVRGEFMDDWLILVHDRYHSILACEALGAISGENPRALEHLRVRVVRHRAMLETMLGQPDILPIKPHEDNIAFILKSYPELAR